MADPSLRERRFTQNFFILILLTILIGVDEVVSNFLLQKFHGYGYLAFFLALVLQLIAAPIQAGISDLWCRKKSLIISIIVTAIACAGIMVSLEGGANYFPLYLAALFKFSCGNMLPICRAGLVDVFYHKGLRFIMGVSTFAIASGYLGFNQSNRFVALPFFTYILIGLLISTAIIAILLKDASDKTGVDWKLKNSSIVSKIKLEAVEIYKHFLKNRKFLGIAIAYAIWEFGFYPVFFLSLDFIDLPKYISLGMILGYILSIITLPALSRIKNTSLIQIGLLLSFSSLIGIGITRYLITAPAKIKILSVIFFSGFGYGYGYMVPCVFAMLTKKYKDVHLQGKLYGLIESADNIAYICSFLLTFLFLKINASNLAVIIVSAAIFLIGSSIYYGIQKSKDLEI